MPRGNNEMIGFHSTERRRGFHHSSVLDLEIFERRLEEHGSADGLEFLSQISHDLLEAITSQVWMRHVSDFFRSPGSNVAGEDESPFFRHMFGSRGELSIRKGAGAALTKCIIGDWAELAGLFKGLDSFRPLLYLGTSFDQRRIESCFLQDEC